MNDALDINSNSVVYAEQIYKKCNTIRSRVGIPKGVIVDFYCPECRSPVFLKTRAGASPWFEHEHLDKENRTAIHLACSRYTNADKREYKPVDTYRISGAIPIYLLGKSDLFKLRVYFPQLSDQSMKMLVESNAKVCLFQNNSLHYVFSSQNVNYIDIATYTKHGFEVQIKDSNGDVLRDVPEEVKRKWVCGISAIDVSRDIFHFWNDGGMRVSTGGFIYVGTSYRILKSRTDWNYDKENNAIEIKKVGEVNFKNLASIDVYELTPIEVTTESLQYFAKRGYLLKHRNDEIIPLWPPAVSKGRDLIYKDKTSLFLHKTSRGNIKDQKLFTLEGNKIIQIQSRILKINDVSEIVQINVGFSKPIMLGGELTPMLYDIHQDENAMCCEARGLELKVEDKNACAVATSYKELPIEGKFYIKSNLPFVTYFKRGNFVIYSSFNSGYIEGVKFDVEVFVDCGSWGKYCYSMQKKNYKQGTINWDSVYRRLLLCHGQTIMANKQLQQNLARRHILPIDGIRFNPLERRVYDQLEDYCKGLAMQIRKHGDRQSQQMMSFLLSFLRLRFASSLYAFHKTLERRLHKVEATLRQQLVMEAEDSGSNSSLQDVIFEGEDEDDLVVVESLLQNRTQDDLEWERECLKSMLKDMADLTGDSSKMKLLLQTLDQRKDRQTGRIQQTVIFTRFYDTLTDIVKRLCQADPQMLVGTYSGQGAQCFNSVTGRMVNLDREEVKERFLRSEVDILVCTDAAAEGLNLQTADLLVNFDLGWNPMKVEQRIGRIDRIGQKHEDIYVLNLCYAGSAEEVVYGRLLNRLANANMIVGTQQVSLLPVEQEEFSQLAEGTLTPEELMARAQERLVLQRQHTESMEISPKELYEIYKRMAQIDDQRTTPVNLEAIWETLSQSQYLRHLGCTVSDEPAKPALTLFGIDGIPSGTVLTTSRALYEEGLADGGARVHFASYGDPFFDAILEHLSSFELPSCVRRIAVPVPGLEDVEVVIYVAICRGDGGVCQMRLIRAWSDLKDLALAEDETINDEEIMSQREQLYQLVLKEFEPYLVADRIERENIRAALVHEMLNFLVIQDFLKVRASFAGENALFWPVLKEVASLIEEREPLQATGLPADILRRFTGELLFACQVPTIGDKTILPVPRIMGRAAVEAASRLADSMKKKRGRLLVDTVLARLQREVEVRKRLIN
ncbi:helicase domain protein [Desulfofarcimen acetoxidans DSM 771]|uniref:Helicase domain protein n=1 Tax=Desulfofarcimen acetoxidans (strain ATCC 49208 / DSM 771 / KCTC 5769 / VKM B-1644 / 5575) TaxID=485916 RepID=C8VW51_DESAS|nr:helicase-related protein [Desulfofarcimen acetoxidans]ACV62403.1 helicase domain protein [Desulfofarcimen acetoxidans DSM 771]